MFIYCKKKNFITVNRNVISLIITIHETEIISVSAISEVEMVEIISVLNLKKSDSRN
jgi:hypothetical protein